MQLKGETEREKEKKDSLTADQNFSLSVSLSQLLSSVRKKGKKVQSVEKNVK